MKLACSWDILREMWKDSFKIAEETANVQDAGRFTAMNMRLEGRLLDMRSAGGYMEGCGGKDEVSGS